MENTELLGDANGCGWGTENKSNYFKSLSSSESAEMTEINPPN